MSKTNEVTIKIPEPPDGWVFDGLRYARCGDKYLYRGEWILCNVVGTITEFPVAIKSTPPWAPPKNIVDAILLVLGPGWAVYTHGRWLWFDCKPTRSEWQYGEMWSAPTTHWVRLPHLDHIVPPEIGRCWKIGEPQQ